MEVNLAIGNTFLNAEISSYQEFIMDTARI
jgi:hypothetical protein